MDYKNVLITGTAGFIASHLCRYLVKRYPYTRFIGIDKLTYCGNVHNMDDYKNLLNFIFIEGDICDKIFINRLLYKYNIDCIIHLAAYTAVDMSFGDSIVYSRNNVEGTHTLLEMTREYNKVKKFIYMSTDEVYGPTAEFVTETAEFNPTNPYSATKAAAEMLCHAYINAYHMPIVITRANNIYGLNQYDEKVIPKFIHQIMKMQPITIHGKGEVVRSFLHVDDFCKAYEIVLLYGKVNEIYNIGTDFEISIRELSEKMVDIMRTNSTIQSMLTTEQKEWLNPDNIALISYVPDRIFNDTSYRINCDKIHKLGWNEAIDFNAENGLTATIIGYVQAFNNKLARDKYNEEQATIWWRAHAFD